MNPRLTPEIPVTRLQELFIYNTRLGSIVNRKTGRKLLPDQRGLVQAFDGESKLRKNLLYRNLAYILGSGSYIPAGKKVLSLNLNDEDIAFHNLKLVDQTVYREIKIALKNLAGELKITQHSQDKLAYVVSWLEVGKERKFVLHDLIAAEQKKRKKVFELAKFVNKYIYSN